MGVAAAGPHLGSIPGDVAAAIIEAGRRMDSRGWVPATAGNFSMRLEAGRIAITRSGFHKGFLTAESLMVVDGDGRPEESNARPSAETGLHCGIYQRWNNHVGPRRELSHRC